MDIIHVGKHGPHSNQDEDAITYALEQLGHRVLCVEERSCQNVQWKTLKGDLLLFHKWCDPFALQALKMPAVKWDWDLVESNDPTILHLDQARRRQVLPVEPYCLVCFYSDGDWVAKDTTGKRVQLMQGADERVTGFGTPYPGAPSIVFTGTLDYHGAGRREQIESIQSRYGEQFWIIGDKPSTRLHGKELAKLLASAKIVIAPKAPSTDLYWSNRVYLTLGFGGFLVHPYCKKLAEQYPREAPNGVYPCPGTKMEMYECQGELYGIIDYYLNHPMARHSIRYAGYQHTIENHTYRHRCQELIRIVRERL